MGAKILLNLKISWSSWPGKRVSMMRTEMRLKNLLNKLISSETIKNNPLIN